MNSVGELCQPCVVASPASESGVLRPLVIGAPRTGFSLLIAVINSILDQPEARRPRPWRDRLLDLVSDAGGAYVTHKYREPFDSFGVAGDLIFNGEFHRLVGGPKWLDRSNPRLACFRKYFGIRGQGDFLLVTSHPREVLESYRVVHSHTAPALWLKEPHYDPFAKFASVRNPIGAINSASFSLNAMASEYIQRFLPNESEDFIRQRHGLYKLTDLEFVRGLVKFLKGYLDEFIPVMDRYHVMKWENLISDPARTIQDIAGQLGIGLTADRARRLWEPMDHTNLLQFHKHNYRRGKGIVGDWKNSLVNEHMEIFREFGFDDCLAALGYPPVPTFNTSDYSPYQRLVASHLRRGEVYRHTGDADLFGFAFNKSNIDASKFNFKSFPKRKWTQVERTTVANDALVEAVSDVAESACERINGILDGAIGAISRDGASSVKNLRLVSRQCDELLVETSDSVASSRVRRGFQNLISEIASSTP